MGMPNTDGSGRTKRRAAWKALVRRERAATGLSRRLTNYALQTHGASWRTLGLPGEFGGPLYGPANQEPTPPKRKDPRPFGVRCVVMGEDGRCKMERTSDGRS